MENLEIRREAAKNGLKLWEVAEACGMTDSTFFTETTSRTTK